MGVLRFLYAADRSYIFGMGRL
uniref:Uncharacterized protein n=1 Tax=Arundo donax TaxID=35708 RepID=A0A0A8YMH1_ARUDO